MTKLTKTVCDEAAYPAEKGPHGYHVVWDQQMPGFGLRCNPGGSKVFVCRYRAGRRQRLLKLGHFPVLTVHQARQLAREVLVQTYRGIDPLEERRREERRGITLANLWDRYLEDYAKPHYKSRTLREVKGAWRRYFQNSLWRSCGSGTGIRSRCFRGGAGRSRGTTTSNGRGGGCWNWRALSTYGCTICGTMSPPWRDD